MSVNPLYICTAIPTAVQYDLGENSSNDVFFLPFILDFTTPADTTAGVGHRKGSETL